MIARVIVTPMDVYLVPAGPDRHVLYCESARDKIETGQGEGGGIRRKMRDAFVRVLAAIEREDAGAGGDGASGATSAGAMARARSRLFGWMAERVAEQRVLWGLQGQTRVRAFHPASLDGPGALAAIERCLRAESRRHQRWLWLDTILLLVSLLLTVIPGPNLPGYYFTFRVVGHVLSIRGARQGLGRVSWDLQASPPLGELFEAVGLPSAERARVARSVASQLGLPRLPRFCDRVLGGAA